MLNNNDLLNLIDIEKVLHQLLLQIRTSTSSDAGTIYLKNGDCLKFCVFQNDSLSSIQIKQMEEDKVHPVLVAAYLHDELVRIHPFIDGNGRTSRLLMNLYLLRNGYVIIILKGSNDAKVGYYKALEKSHTEHFTEDFQQLVVEAEIVALQRCLSIMA